MSWPGFKLRNRFDTIERATIVPSMSKAATSVRRRRKGTKSRGGNSIRVVKGRVVLRVPGFQGVQRLSPSHLIHHINKKNLKSAAKHVLKKSRGNKKTKRRKRTGRGRRRRK